MRNCAVCKKKISKENGTFFRVPRCEESRKKWSVICKMPFTPNSRLCIDHFSRSQIITAGRRFMLMPSAIPIMQNQQIEVFTGLPEAYEPLVNTEIRDPLEQSFQEYPEVAELPIKMENTNDDPFKEQQTQTDSPISHDDVIYYRNKIKKLQLENEKLKRQLAKANLAVESMRKIFTGGQITQDWCGRGNLHEGEKFMWHTAEKTYEYDSSAEVVRKPANYVQHPILNYDDINQDVIVIKSEDISDNEQSHSGKAMYADYDNCITPKYIPKVCLEEEDEKLFATDLHQQQSQPSPRSTTQTVQRQQHNSKQQKYQRPEVSKLLHHSQQTEITTQKIGGIRVSSIGSMANMMKTLQKSLNNSNNNNKNTGNNNSFAAA